MVILRQVVQMSVLAEAISVIIPCSVLESKYPGGAAQYARDCPNATYCVDDHLTRVGFMAPADVRSFVERLQQVGLVHTRDGQAVDLVIVDQVQGPTACNWLEGGRHPDGYSAVWLAGTVPGWLSHPKGWKIRQSAELHFSANDKAESRFLGLSRDGNLETVLDFKTGKQVYVGRVPQRGNG